MTNLHISKWNIYPNIEWFVLLQVVSPSNAIRVSLYADRLLVGTEEGLIAQATSADWSAIQLAKQYTGDYFTVNGYEYEFDYFDDRWYYHIAVSGGISDPDALITVKPFFDLDEQEHALYKNADIAYAKAKQMLDAASHVRTEYDLSLAYVPSIELNDIAQVTNTFFEDTSFKGVVEGFTLTCDKDSARMTSCKVCSYEQMEL